MARRKKGVAPQVREHKTHGLDYVWYQGKPKYLGPTGSAKARKAYREFLDEWEANHKEIVAVAPTSDLARHVDAYVAALKGTISPGERDDIRRNLGTLSAKFGQWQPDQFRAKELKDLRKTWILAGHVRGTINKAVGRVRRFFRYLVAEELAAPETLAILQALPDLPPGGPAEDNPEVEPVPEADFWATLEHLGEPAKTVALIQFYGGLRPGAACSIKADEIYREGEVVVGRRVLKIPAGLWLFIREPTGRRQKTAVHVFGPKLQAVLAPAIEARPAGQLFRRERGSDYDRHIYHLQVSEAAAKAKVAHWHPHMIRHLFVTRMDAETDLLTASEAAGHASASVSLIYLQRRILQVAEVVKRMG